MRKPYSPMTLGKTDSGAMIHTIARQLHKCNQWNPKHSIDHPSQKLRARNHFLIPSHLLLFRLLSRQGLRFLRNEKHLFIITSSQKK